MAFLLDSSGSLSDDEWTKTKNFVESVINNLNVGRDETLVSVSSFSENYRLHFRLNTHYSSRRAADAVRGIVKMGAGTDTTEGLRKLLSVVFQPEAGDRKDVPNRVVLITDGRADNRRSAVAAANRLKHISSAYIAVVGVGPDADVDELKMLATSPDDVIMATDYGSLQSVVRQLLAAICPDEKQIGRQQPPSRQSKSPYNSFI